MPIHVLESATPRHMSQYLQNADFISASRMPLDHLLPIYSSIHTLIGIILTIFADLRNLAVVTRGEPSSRAMDGSPEQSGSAGLGDKSKDLTRTVDTSDNNTTNMDDVSQFEHSNLVSWALSDEYDPEQPVLIDAMRPDRNISKQTATKLVARLAGAFEEDSTVCLHLSNDILYPILVHAIWASKCRWTGTNTAYTSPELEHHFRISETRYVVTEEEHLETVRAAVDHSGTKIEVILFSDILYPRSPVEDDHRRCCGRRSSSPGSHKSGYWTLHDLLRHDSTREELEARLEKIDIDSTATLMSTSGTTGPPKMAARTHRAHMTESRAAADNDSAKDYEIRRLWCVPIFHGFAFPTMVINSLRLGIPGYFMKRYVDKTYADKVHEFQITETLAPPPMLLRLVNSPPSHPKIQSLKIVSTGGAPCVGELRAKFLKLYDEKPPSIIQVWGMTEGGWYTTFKYPEADDPVSVGRPIPGFEIKMSEESRSQLTNGQEVGELFVRGPEVMSEYLGNPEATAKVFVDGWLRTGDVGYIKDGKVYLVDRAKDLVKVNGWQVSPSEIEDALLVSRDVKDAAVIGFGEGVSEHPMAFVVRANEDGGGVSANSLKDHLLRRLTRYKVASCEVRFVDTIPKSATGKILKNKLREMAAVLSHR